MRLRTKTPVLALCWFVSCANQESASLLEQQSAISRLDATRAELRHFEQEALKEQAHVDELASRVQALRSREAVLDQEAADMAARVATAEDRLRGLKERSAAIDVEAKAASAKIEEDEKAKNRIPELEARLKLLQAEFEKIGAELEAAKQDGAARDPAKELPEKPKQPPVPPGPKEQPPTPPTAESSGP